MLYTLNLHNVICQLYLIFFKKSHLLGYKISAGKNVEKLEPSYIAGGM